MRHFTYAQVARKIIKAVERLNNVQFGNESSSIVMDELQAFNNQWNDEYSKLEHQLAELELALYDYLGVGRCTHEQLMAYIKERMQKPIDLINPDIKPVNAKYKVDGVTFTPKSHIVAILNACCNNWLTFDKLKIKVGLERYPTLTWIKLKRLAVRLAGRGLLLERKSRGKWNSKRAMAV